MLFFGYAMFAAVDWLYSRIPVRFPDIKICLSEGGIGWVPGLLDRLDHVGRYQELYGTWKGIDLMPAEVLQRNFCFCAIEDPSTFVLRDRIGVDHLLVESDYPHLDTHLAEHAGRSGIAQGSRRRRHARSPGRTPPAFPPPGARRAA